MTCISSGEFQNKVKIFANLFVFPWRTIFVNSSDEECGGDSKEKNLRTLIWVAFYFEKTNDHKEKYKKENLIYGFWI